MLAGLLLGPTVFGALAGGGYRWLFPASSLPLLDGLGLVGVSFYMFAVGNELNVRLLRNEARGVIAISLASTVVPLAAAGALAILLVGDRSLFPAGPSALAKSAFFATALAVTAFPVMARIIDDQGLAGTRVGTLSLAAGSITDAVAWCLLAITLANAQAAPASALATVIGTIAFVALTLLAVRPVLHRLGTGADRSEIGRAHV